eukprot:m51a1_g2113 putative protein iws1 homolog (485) ;mRNA; f:1651299-1652881
MAMDSEAAVYAVVRDVIKAGGSDVTVNAIVKQSADRLQLDHSLPEVRHKLRALVDRALLDQEGEQESSAAGDQLAVGNAVPEATVTPEVAAAAAAEILMPHVPPAEGAQGRAESSASSDSGSESSDAHRKKHRKHRKKKKTGLEDDDEDDEDYGSSKEKKGGSDEGSSDGGSDSDDKGGRKKRKKHSKSKRKKKSEDDSEDKPRKRRRSAKDGTAAAAAGDEKLTAVEEAALSQRDTRRRKSQVNHDQLEAEAAQIVAEMHRAADEDDREMEAKRPALRKLEILDEIRRSLVRLDIQEDLLQHNVLDAMVRWLKPLPGGALPNARLRTEMLRVLRDLPTRGGEFKELLKESRIGLVVSQLAHHPQETQENKFVLETIIDKWSRVIFDLSSGYEGIGRALKESGAIEGPRPAIAGTSASSSVDKLNSRPVTLYGKAGMFPDKEAMDFVVAPKSKVSVEMKGELAASSKKPLSDLERVFRNTFRRK